MLICNVDESIFFRKRAVGSLPISLLQTVLQEVIVMVEPK
jgi:hypothetical protein